MWIICEMEEYPMKTFNTIMKILAALAAITGIIYVIATYGDKIVAWAKKMLASCPCKCNVEDCADCECENECPCQESVEEAPAEAPVEEVDVEEPVIEVPVAESEPVADECDFAE